MAKGLRAQDQRRVAIRADLGKMVERPWRRVRLVGHERVNGSCTVSDVRYHDRIKDLQGPLSGGPGPFARASWYELLERHGAAARYAVAASGDAAVCLPLTPDLQPLTNWYAFTWQPLATDPPPAPEALQAIAADLDTARIDFAKLESSTADRLQAAFRAAGWTVLRSETDTNHILRPAGRSFAKYLATRPGPLRTTLKRKARKLDVTLSTRFDPEEWQAFEDIYRASWKPAEGDPDLLRAFAQAESEAGHFLFAMARHEDTPVAAQFWTLDGGTAHIHKLAHRENATSLSPGTVLTAALFEYALDTARVDLVDFGTGDDAYKRDWMEEQRPRYTLTCLRARNLRNWPTLARHLVSRVLRR